MKFLILFLFISHVTFAQDIQTTPPLATKGSEVVPEIVKPEESPVEEVVTEAEPVPVIKTYSSKENRADSFGTVMVGYQFITSWIPSKGTFSYTQTFNEKWSLESEYSIA